MPPRRLHARLLLVRKCPRLLRLLVPFALHLLVLPSRLRLTVRSVASSSVRAASSRFAAVACSSIRRAAPLLALPLLRLVPRRSLRFHSLSPFSLSLFSPLSPFSRLRHPLPSR